ncbi:hypothetical protein CBA19CS91_41550 [Paraburkholderia hospita]|nr:hypothetical protein CBA19CS91_41550 [Paraburkholderia hospita]
MKHEGKARMPAQTQAHNPKPKTLHHNHDKKTKAA